MTASTYLASPLLPTATLCGPSQAGAGAAWGGQDWLAQGRVPGTEARTWELLRADRARLVTLTPDPHIRPFALRC